MNAELCEAGERLRAANKDVTESRKAMFSMPYRVRHMGMECYLLARIERARVARLVADLIYPGMRHQLPCLLRKQAG